MFCLAMSPEILRMCKAMTKLQDFLKFARILIGRIIKLGGPTNNMKKLLLKLLIVTRNVSLKLKELVIRF